MTDETPQYKWPIPDQSDEIADIADIVAAGLTAIENSFYVPPGSKAAAAASTSWPLGLSVMGLSATTAGDGGWPRAVSSTVVTVRRNASESAFQWWVVASSSAIPEVRVRTAGASGWSPWAYVTWLGQPSAEASGQIKISGGAGVRSVVVMLPANRFTKTPIVTVSNATSRPDVQTGCGTAGVSATQFTCYVNRTDTADASVNWLAVEGVD